MRFFTTIIACFVATPVLAFDCPGYIDEAQAMIDKVSGDMAGMAAMMSADDMAQVHALLDDAKSFLSEARQSHEEAQNADDHGLSIAKAGAALGFARAADILHFKYMEQ